MHIFINNLYYINIFVKKTDLDDFVFFCCTMSMLWTGH